MQATLSMSEAPTGALSGALPPSLPSRQPGTNLSATQETRLTCERSAGESRDRIGRFAINQRLGEGAFGVVYRAYDPQLDREVALKVAKPGTLQSSRHVERFLREAKSAAQLRHPNIVPLYEAGMDGERYYIASALIQGRSLADTIESEALGIRAAVQAVRRLAEALAYAHQKGVIHRDVKPANVMLDELGEPLLLDFGLAARKEDAEKLTQAGAILGTPLYMAPEQATGGGGEAVPASDQYSLGVMLYELLTGRTPFGGPPELVLFHHMRTQPTSPRKLNRKVPRDLETVCLKCLEKDLDRRYADCQELADDLRRWLDGESVKARRIHAAERFARWCKREPRLAVAVLAAVAALAGVATLFGVNAHQESRNAVRQGELRRHADQSAQKANEEAGRADAAAKTARLETKRAEREKANAEGQLEVARATLVTTQLARAYAVWDRDPVRARELLHDYELCPIDRRDFAWHLLDRATPPERFPPSNPPGLACLGFAASGQLLAGTRWSHADRGLDSISDATTGKLIQKLEAPARSVGFARFSPDGRTLAASSDAGLVLWNVTTGQRRLQIPADKAARITCLTWSPDGTRLAACRQLKDEKSVVIWDAATGNERVVRKHLSQWVHGLTFSPDQRQLAMILSASASIERASGTGGIVLCDLVSERESSIELAPKGLFTCVAFSPDGRTLAAGDMSANVRTWDSLGRALASCANPGRDVRSVVFSPDSGSLAALGDDGKTHVFNAASLAQRAVFQGEKSGLQRNATLAFSPDGRLLVSSADGTTVRFWDLDRRLERHVLKVTDKGSNRPQFTRGGETLLTFNDSGTGELKCWDPQTGRERPNPVPENVRVQGYCLRPDGKTVAVELAKDRNSRLLLDTAEVRLVELRTGRQVWSLKDLFQSDGVKFSRVTPITFSPDGKYLALNCAARQKPRCVRLLEASTGLEAKPLEGQQGPLRHIAFSPDGRLLASEGGATGSVHVWEVQSGRLAVVLPAPTRWQGMDLGNAGAVEQIAFSPDGKLLAVGRSVKERVEVWDLGAREVRAMLAIKAKDLVFMPQGGCLVGKTATGLMTWQPATGAVATLPTQGSIGLVAWSADGRYLAAATHTGFIGLWVAATGEERVGKRFGRSVTDLAFSPDGRCLAAGVNRTIAGEGIVLLFDAATGQERTRLTPTVKDVWRLAFSPDGQVLASGHGDGRVRLWGGMPEREIGELNNSGGAVQALAFSTDGRLLVKGGGDRDKPSNLHLWEVATGRHLGVLKGHSMPVLGVAYAASHESLASCGEDGTVRLWDMVGRRQRWNVKGHAERAWAVAFSPDGKAVASCGAIWEGTGRQRKVVCGEVKLWDSDSGAERGVFRGHDAAVVTLAFSPDGRTLATGSLDGDIRLWDLRSGGCRKALKGHRGAISSIAYSPDGKTLASGACAATGEVKLWDVAEGRERARNARPIFRDLAGMFESLEAAFGSRGKDSALAPVRAIAFSPDGQSLAAVGDDRVVRLLDAATGQPLETFGRHSDRGDVTTSAAFSPDGRILATGTGGIPMRHRIFVMDGELKLWRVRP